MLYYFKDLLFILVPLCVGTLFHIHNVIVHKLINKILAFLVYFILFLMGLALGQIPDLFSEVGTIFRSVLCFVVVLNGLNILLLWVYGKKNLALANPPEHLKTPSFFKSIVSSLQLAAVVVLGFVIGFFLKDSWHFNNQISTYTLMVLLFLIGVQLRNSGIPLRQVLLNKHGTITAALFVVSCLIGAVICSLILNIPIKQSLAVSSGFGWYSLSGILLQDAFGPVTGSIAFLNDMGREFFALLAIPVLMRYSPCTAVGIGGATSLDFTLPVIQRSGGMSIVPIAISFGFIVNILAPVLMIVFSRM